MYKTNRKMMKEVKSDLLTKGVFYQLYQLPSASDLPFHSDVSAAVLDLAYFSRSSNKFISPIVETYLDDDGKLTDTTLTSLALAIKSMNLVNWTRLYEIQKSEYNPFENYRMTESEVIETDNTTTDTQTLNTKICNNRTSTNTGTITDAGSGSNNLNRYGFNSSTAAGDTEGTSTTSNTQTNDLSNNEEVETTNTGTIGNNNVLDGEVNRELTRAGNIGVITSQQMAQSEIDLWQWNYFETVFKTIDTFLCLDIY